MSIESSTPGEEDDMGGVVSIPLSSQFHDIFQQQTCFHSRLPPCVIKPFGNSDRRGVGSCGLAQVSTGSECAMIIGPMHTSGRYGSFVKDQQPSWLWVKTLGLA